MRVEITESQRMALVTLLGEYIRTPEHTEVFINCSEPIAVETTPEELFNLFMNPEGK